MMNHSLSRIIAIVLLLACAPAWSASTKQEVLELKAQVAEMQKDLAEIKKLLQEGARAPAAAPQQAGFNPQTVSLGSSPVRGNADAPITVIAYSDYQCPFCARSYRDVLPLLEQEYIDTGKVRYVMREFPLTSIHANAMNASLAALCAGEQGKYWEMHDLMFDNQKQLGVENLKSFAVTLGLEAAAFNECLDTQKHQKTVEADLASGAKLGVTGTPAFAVGRTDAKDPDKVNLTVLIKGARPIDQFRGSINDLLAQGK